MRCKSTRAGLTRTAPLRARRKTGDGRLRLKPGRPVRVTARCAHLHPRALPSDSPRALAGPRPTPCACLLAALARSVRERPFRRASTSPWASTTAGWRWIASVAARESNRHFRGHEQLVDLLHSAFARLRRCGVGDRHAVDADDDLEIWWSQANQGVVDELQQRAGAVDAAAIIYWLAVSSISALCSASSTRASFRRARLGRQGRTRRGRGRCRAWTTSVSSSASTSERFVTMSMEPSAVRGH